jgi:hypothetical protein
MIINFRSALDAITVFGSVGSTNYDVTFTNLDGQQQGFIRGIPAGRLSAQIMDILRARRAKAQRNHPPSRSRHCIPSAR